MKLHVFATILALYPFTKTEEIAEEFGISVNKIRRMARICRVSKNAEFRSEIGKMNGRKSVDRFVRRKIRREQRSVKLWNDGLAMDEIAKRLHISKKTVYKYLLHAKKSGVKLNRKS
jgi:DNA-binding CsgD family transcriptional regulator